MIQFTKSGTQYVDIITNKLVFIILSLTCLYLLSCSRSVKEDQRGLNTFVEEDTGKIKIILDTDMGSDCDDVGALALLHRYADLGKTEIIGCIYSSGKVPFGAGVVEAINIYYGRSEIPVGASWDEKVGDPVDKMDAEKLAKDTGTFKNTIVYNRDAEEQTRLIRRLLATQEDNSIDYITIGHTRGLYELLTSESDDISRLEGFELVDRKIRRWIALGALNANNKDHHHVKDWNFFFNGTAAYTKYLVEQFPKPVYFIDAGTDIMTGRSLKDTPAGNIVRTAYEYWLRNYEHKSLDDQRPSWDIVTVYFAVEGLGDYLEEEEAGWLEFDIEKGCRWISGENRLNQHYIIQKDGIAQDFADYLNQMISEPPFIASKVQ